VSRRTGSIRVREAIWRDSATHAENIATKIETYTHRQKEIIKKENYTALLHLFNLVKKIVVKRLNKRQSLYEKKFLPCMKHQLTRKVISWYVRNAGIFLVNAKSANFQLLPHCVHSKIEGRLAKRRTSVSGGSR